MFQWEHSTKEKHKYKGIMLDKDSKGEAQDK